MSPDDVYIAVLGPSGAGKSLFIESLKRNAFEIEMGWFSDYEPNLGLKFEMHRMRLGRTLCLVKIPSFGILENVDPNKLRDLVTFLNELSSRGIRLSALLWLHRISDVRLRGSNREGLEVLKHLIGPDAMSAVRMVTTFWNRQNSTTGKLREQQLADTSFEPFLKAGGGIHRFHPANADGAEDVLRRVLTKARPVILQSQHEMLLEHKAFEQTSLYLGLKDSLSPNTSIVHHNRPTSNFSPLLVHSGPSFTTQPTHEENLVTSSRDIVIAVMGVTGAGKSQFIQHLTDQVVPVSSGLESFTENITIYRCSLPDIPKFFLIDTPGFDDTHRSDLDVLEQLADFLITIWESRVKLRGLIYLESILETGTGRAPDRHVAMFRQLCGEHAFANVALVTTFWDVIAEDEFRNDILKIDAEDRLRNDPKHWAGMIAKGSKMFRHRNSKETAVRIVKYLTQKQNQVVLNLQEELGEEEKALPETAAGTVVAEQLTLLKHEHERQVDNMRKEIQQALEERDTIWQRRLEQMKQEYEANISRQMRASKTTDSVSSMVESTPHTNLTFGTANISGEASAVLGNVYKNEHKTYQIQNATFVFENKGRYRGLQRSRRGYDGLNDDREEIKSVLRDFLRQDENENENPSEMRGSRTNLTGPYDRHSNTKPLIPYDSYSYSYR